jgi:hypothetical protein
MTHEVYFILDSGFVGDLWSLSRRAHVWVLKSAHNESAARAIWDRDEPGYSRWHGVTTFDGSESPIDTFYAFLGTVAEHHEGWDTIHVIGLALESARPQRVAIELGTESFALAAEDGGFAIGRAAQQGAEADKTAR